MKNKITQVLSLKPFLFLFLAQIFSQIAINMMNFVLIFVVYELTRSNTAVSGIVLAFTIPAIIMGIPAGVYVDKWNKKQVLFVANLTRAIILFFLAFSYANIPAIYIVAFLVSLITQFFIPAETPMIPVLVKKDQLLSANALFGMGVYGSILVAYALSGPLLLFYGKTPIFLFLSFCFFVATIFASLIKIKGESLEDNTAASPVHLIDELKHAVDLVMKTKEIYQSLVLLTLTQILVLVLAVLGPGYASQVLGIEPEKFPVFFVTPAAIGMVLCVIILTYFYNQSSKRIMATIGVFVSGIVMLLLPHAAYFADIFHVGTLFIMIIFATLLGISNALVFVPSNTILQEETSNRVRGKVYGALNALIGVFSLIPVIAAGSLSDIFGVSNVITLVGFILLSTGFFRLFH